MLPMLDSISLVNSECPSYTHAYTETFAACTAFGGSIKALRRVNNKRMRMRKRAVKRSKVRLFPVWNVCSHSSSLSLAMSFTSRLRVLAGSVAACGSVYAGWRYFGDKPVSLIHACVLHKNLVQFQYLYMYCTCCSYLCISVLTLHPCYQHIEYAHDKWVVYIHACMILVREKFVFCYVVSLQQPLHADDSGQKTVTPLNIPSRCTYCMYMYLHCCVIDFFY